jgi:hypothetical protein
MIPNIKKQLTPYEKSFAKEIIRLLVNIICLEEELFLDCFNMELKCVKRKLSDLEHAVNKIDVKISEDISYWSSSFHAFLRKCGDTPFHSMLYDVISDKDHDHLHFLNSLQDGFEWGEKLPEKINFVLVQKKLDELCESRLISNEYYVAWMGYILWTNKT